MAIIYTRHHDEIIVDDEDFTQLNQYVWHLCNGYAVTTTNQSNFADIGASGPNVNVRMHRMLMGLANGDLEHNVDHINHNRLDNRKANLRVCSSQQNAWNRQAKAGKYKGVFYDKSGQRNKRWRCIINGHCYGYFDTAEEAAVRYNDVVGEVYAEFATYNEQLDTPAA